MKIHTQIMLMLVIAFQLAMSIVQVVRNERLQKDLHEYVGLLLQSESITDRAVIAGEKLKKQLDACEAARKAKP